MKLFSLILSIVVFFQSLSVCGPRFSHSVSEGKDNTCTIDYSKKSPVKSCCSKLQQKHDKDTQDKNQKGCCGDDCKCLTCAKVFLNTLPYFDFPVVIVELLVERNIKPIRFHSFDFHPSLIQPPQV